PTAKQYYDMLSAAQKPLHQHTNVSQFDAIAHVLALKSECGISRDGFDKMLTVFGSLLPEGHILPKSLYEAQKLLRSLKMPYLKIHACPKDAYCLGKNMQTQITVQNVSHLGGWR